MLKNEWCHSYEIDILIKPMPTQLFLLIYLFIFMSLAGCVSPTAPQVEKNLISSNTLNINTVKIWGLKGVLSIRTPKDVVTADYEWQQQNQQYVISLFGPLGTHAIKLTGEPNQVLLETSDGQKHTASSPEELLKQQLNLTLPISNLYYWIRGLPNPHFPAKKYWDAKHHLIELVQQSWVIQYKSYTSENGMDVPDKMILTNSDLNIKIIVKQWFFH